MPDLPLQPPPPSLSRLPVPPERAIYRALCTDHYPWSEVMSDLSTRQADSFSGLLDLWQEGRWARFCFVQGTQRAGFTQGGREVNLTAAMQAMPRAAVTLTSLDASVSDLLWTLRDASETTPLSTTWPGAQQELQRQHFTGALLSGSSCSYWKSGQLLDGTLPQSGAPCHLLSAYRTGDRSSLLTFWQELLDQVNRQLPLNEPWRQATLSLSNEHPCLDPFAQEVVLRDGQLHAEDDLDPQELRPALSAALKQMLARNGVRLTDLPLTTLRQHPEWHAAGLEVS